MGACRSKPAAEEAATAEQAPDPKANLPVDFPSSVSADHDAAEKAATLLKCKLHNEFLSKLPPDSTAALIQSVLPTAIPLVCQVVSQQLIADPASTLLKNEEPLVEFDKTAPASEQVLRDIQLQMKQITLVPAATLQSDMEQMSTFAWPHKDNAATLMEHCQMTVLDIVDLYVKVLLGNGIEFVVPVENKFGIPMTLEVGCGGKVIGNDAWFECTIPKVRLWIVQQEVPVEEQDDDDDDVEDKHNDTTTRKQVMAYVAFIGRPDLKPHVHINADRGKGDFLDFVLDEAGSLDDVVESILVGFGPSEFYELEEQKQKAAAAEEEKKKDEQQPKQSWVGNALGKTISKAIGKFVGVGNNRPLEIDLTEAVTSAIDTAMGKPRAVEAVEADLERLQQELVRSKQAELEEEARPQHKKQNKTTVSSSAFEEEKKEDDHATTTTLVEKLEKLEERVLTPLTSCCG